MNYNDWHYEKAITLYGRVADGTHDSPKRTTEGKYLITSKHIKSHELDLAEAYKISIDDYNKIIERSYVSQWNVLISMIGAYCGFCYIQKRPEIDFAVKNVGIFDTRDRNSGLWLYYFLTSNEGVELLKSRTTGSSQPYIALNELRNLPIKINKNKRIMDKIVEILSSIDDKIELNIKINKNLEELAQTLYKQWFVDFEFPNEDGEPYKSSGGEMVESELGLIPVGWQIKTIDEISTFNKRGLSPVYTSDSHGIPVINQRCIRNHTIIEEAVQYHDLNQKQVKDELYHNSWDVLINSMGVGTLGRVSISSLKHDKIVHSCITILRPNTELIYESIFSYMMLSLENKFIEMGEGSTGQTSLNNKLLGKMLVVLPPFEVQKGVANVISSLQKQIDNNLLINDKLSKLRDELLPKLMNGEIEVPIKE